jgi:uncharacterized protein (TIGR00730 family)
MNRICVFCGASAGKNKAYIKAAAVLGRVLAKEKISLVYGGGKVGVMGHLAKACLDAGGEVIGVIPQQLFDMGLAYKKVTRLHVVGTMHERKAMMAELSDGFIALPGGLGTIEEFCEALTWAQLGIHHKPCGLLNTAHYYDKFIDFIEHAVKQDFLEIVYKKMIQVDEDPRALLKKFEEYEAPRASKVVWVLKKKGNVVR